MVGEHKSEDFCIECSKGIDMDKIKRILLNFFRILGEIGTVSIFM